MLFFFIMLLINIADYKYVTSSNKKTNNHFEKHKKLQDYEVITQHSPEGLSPAATYLLMNYTIKISSTIILVTLLDWAHRGIVELIPLDTNIIYKDNKGDDFIIIAKNKNESMKSWENTLFDYLFSEKPKYQYSEFIKDNFNYRIVSEKNLVMTNYKRIAFHSFGEDIFKEELIKYFTEISLFNIKTLFQIIKYKFIPFVLQILLFIPISPIILVLYIIFAQPSFPVSTVDFLFIGFGMMFSFIFYFFMIIYILTTGFVHIAVIQNGGKKLKFNQAGLELYKHTLGFKEYINAMKDRLNFHAKLKTDVETEYLSYAVAFDLIENPFDYNIDNMISSKEEIKNLSK